MALFYLKTISIFILVFYLNNKSTAQTTISGGIGLSFLDINNENSLENSMRFENTIFLKDSKDLNPFAITGRLKIDRKLAKRFSGSYHFRVFIRKLDANVTIDQDFTPLRGFQGTSQIISTTHAGAINFSPFENIKFGIGGFYQTFEPSHFTILSKENGYVHDPAHQAGCLLNVNFNIKKWSFDLSYTRAVGETFFFNRLADSIHSIELSVLYQFHTFKTKKERKMRRRQKGKE